MSFKPGGGFVPGFGVCLKDGLYNFFLRIFGFHDFQAWGRFRSWAGGVFVIEFLHNWFWNHTEFVCIQLVLQVLEPFPPGLWQVIQSTIQAAAAPPLPEGEFDLLKLHNWLQVPEALLSKGVHQEASI